MCVASVRQVATSLRVCHSATTAPRNRAAQLRSGQPHVAGTERHRRGDDGVGHAHQGLRNEPHPSLVRVALEERDRCHCLGSSFQYNYS